MWLQFNDRFNKCHWYSVCFAMCLAVKMEITISKVCHMLELKQKVISIIFDNIFNEYRIQSWLFLFQHAKYFIPLLSCLHDFWWQSAVTLLNVSLCIVFHFFWLPSRFSLCGFQQYDYDRTRCSCISAFFFYIIRPWICDWCLRIIWEFHSHYFFKFFFYSPSVISVPYVRLFYIVPHFSDVLLCFFLIFFILYFNLVNFCSFLLSSCLLHLTVLSLQASTLQAFSMSVTVILVFYFQYHNFIFIHMTFISDDITYLTLYFVVYFFVIQALTCKS